MSARRLRLRDVSEILGIGESTVRKAMSGNSCNLSLKTIEGIKERAKQLGYIKPGTAEFKSMMKDLRDFDYLERGNFIDKAHKHKRMEILRDQGYSHKEIAQKVGCSIGTVYYHLGNQDEKRTSASYDAGREKAKLTRAARREAIQKRVAAMQEEVDKKQEEIKRMYAQIQEMQNAVNAQIIDLEAAKRKLKMEVA